MTGPQLMTDDSHLVTKAITGHKLSATEQSQLSPDSLTFLTTRSLIELRPNDRKRLSESSLVMLASGKFIVLTRPERDGLSDSSLVFLICGGHVRPDPAELDRLSFEDRVVVEYKLKHR